MTATNKIASGVMARQPTNPNLLSPLGFRFGIQRMPGVNWFCQTVNLPGLSLNEVTQESPFLPIPLAGTRLTFDTLSITFKVDEDLANWTELFTWLVELGTPHSYKQYKGIGLSDATLLVMDSNMNPNFEITFTDMWPASVSGLEFQTTDSSVDYVTCSASFKFKDYEFRPANIGAAPVAGVMGRIDEVIGNQPPLITSPAEFNAAEMQTAVGTVTYTDGDVPADTIIFSISGGADAAFFSIDSETGVLTFNSAPDFETLADDNADGVYEVTVKTYDGTAFDTQTISVTVTNVNEAPSITSSSTFDAAEDQTAVGTVTSTDPDAGASAEYSIIGGVDAAFFSIDSVSGVLTFDAAPDYEDPIDDNADGVYVVTVQVTDGALTDSQAIFVTVTDVNAAPVITSDGGGATADIDAAENQTAVTTVTYTDDDPGDTITFSIIGGVDAAFFSIGSVSGVLTFDSAPDFETMADGNADGVYEVVVQVQDDGVGTLTDTQAISVTVTDVLEAVVDSKAIYLPTGVFPKNAAAGALLSIGNTWSIQSNFIPRFNIYAAYVVSIQNATNNQSQIFIIQDGQSDPQNVHVGIRRNTGGGGVIKDFEWNINVVADVKISYMVTWDGGPKELKLYINGVDQGEADVKNFDSGTGNQSDQVRRIALGNFGTSNFGPLYGDMHSTSLWDVVLSQAEITALDNAGSPDTLDNRLPSGNYTSTANLMHYWRLGVDALDLGKDDGNAAILVDVDEDSSGDLAGNILDYVE